MMPDAALSPSADVDHPWSAGFRTLSGEFDYRIDEIDGRVPPALRGTLFRNGSGRNDLGGHWFPQVQVREFNQAVLPFLNSHTPS